MKTLTHLLSAFIVGIVFSLATGLYLGTFITIESGSEIEVAYVENDDGIWHYVLKPDAISRLRVISDDPLGYTKGDTITFTGRVPEECEDKFYNKQSNYVQKQR